MNKLMEQNLDNACINNILIYFEAFPSSKPA